MKLHILLLTALPMCLAQFSIQGPTDGNRQSQGLKFSQEKGLEYTEAREGGGQGGFSIQGATDGNTQFQIQGASDGHTNFQIQGPSDGGAATYIQGSYDANQVNGKALQYNDPSGYRVNWRSYNRQVPPQGQAEQQYAAQAPVPQARHRARVPQARAPQARHRAQPPPQQQQVAEPAPNYKPYDNAPPQIQQLLHFQQQIPYINVIPEQFRFDADAAIQEQAKQVHEHYRQLQTQQPARAPAPEPRQKSRGHSRSRREANPQRQPQHRVTQAPAEPQPNYSPNVPSHLQALLKYQAQIPYNIIANQVAYRGPDKPYVPHRVNSPQQQPQPQPQQQPQLQQAQYQGQGGAYNAQTKQARGPNYNLSQQQLGYNQQQAGVRPVTENQY